MSSSAQSTRPTREWEPDKPEMPTMLGRYRVLGTIGKGGMGVVFKGFHLNLQRDVAIKTMRIDKISTPNVVNRFRQEIKLIGQMDHDHVVRATDAGEKNGVFFLVMEFLTGLDLNKLVARNGPLSRADACELIRQAALGLEYIHQTLVHRDIKPSNLMLTTAGQVKILDLGLAYCDQDSEGRDQTPTGMVLGTHLYMAPEQARASRTIDGRADIYSLGCTLFKLLTGKDPFSGPEYSNSASQIYAHCHLPLTATPAFELVPLEVRPVLLRMVAKDPAERPGSGREVAEALAPLAVGCAPALLGAAGNDEPKIQALTQPLPDELSRLTQTEPESSAVSTLVVAPRRPRVGRKLALGLAAGVLMVGLAILAWVVMAERRQEDLLAPPAGLRNLDDLALHARHDLLDRLPMAVGFDQVDPSHWQWHRQLGTLDLKGPQPPLFLPLGTTTRPHFTVEVGIRQAPWTGKVGIFWGYTEDADVKKAKEFKKEFARFHVINVVVRSERADLAEPHWVERGTIGLWHDKRGVIRTSYASVAKHDVPSIRDGEEIFVISVQGNRLARALLGPIELTRLCTPNINQKLESRPNEGSIGVFSLGHDATISRFWFIPN